MEDDGFSVWDTLAIAEYVAEKFPAKALWPRDAKRRARARSVCAEMHSGFGALRNAFGMNIEASLPEVGARVLAENAAARADLARVIQLWQEALADSGGPFLFGEYSIADAYFAPVVMRMRTYGAAGAGRRGRLQRARRGRQGHGGVDPRRAGGEGLPAVRGALPQRRATDATRDAATPAAPAASREWRGVPSVYWTHMSDPRFPALAPLALAILALLSGSARPLAEPRRRRVRAASADRRGPSPAVA